MWYGWRHHPRGQECGQRQPAARTAVRTAGRDDNNHGHPRQGRDIRLRRPAPNVNNASGQICGPAATQQLTITIGTGSSDRAVIKGAAWNVHNSGLTIGGWDANISALWSVSVTSTGRVLISNSPSRTTYPIDGFLIVQKGMGYPCPFGGCDLTVTNNLGSSVTVFLGKPTY